MPRQKHTDMSTVSTMTGRRRPSPPAGAGLEGVASSPAPAADEPMTAPGGCAIPPEDRGPAPRGRRGRRGRGLEPGFDRSLYLFGLFNN